MKKLFSMFRPSPFVNLAIAPDVLASLVEKGQIHATDFRCLDFGSKQIVWKIFLSLAKSKINTTPNRRDRE
ncbi:MAG: hypothetical protein M8364_14890 [Methylobacter sp.]|uniref:hypothetical protein n=1 Tax=Methylobacter sp. TaxID=2051955 RepID=UPI002588E654|nr:hypothetical protein [Methylobacter sp.]MCL7422183.1 hypothetical protein [Methylobacter sp.]